MSKRSAQQVLLHTHFYTSDGLWIKRNADGSEIRLPNGRRFTDTGSEISTPAKYLLNGEWRCGMCFQYLSVSAYKEEPSTERWCFCIECERKEQKRRAK